VTDVIDAYGDQPFEAKRINARVLKSLVAKRFLRIQYDPVSPTRYRSWAGTTAKARILSTELALPEFCRVMEAEFKRAHLLPELKSGIARRILEQELERIRQTTLYFLEIEAEGAPPLHKIGITTREVDSRITEIKRFLAPHLAVREIRPVFQLANVSYVEAYFKARFAAWQQTIGQATEYFSFGEQLSQVQTELGLLEGFGDFEPEPPLPANSDRPRFRAVFSHLELRDNPFSRFPEEWIVLTDVVNIGQQRKFADRYKFRYGKRFARLGELWAGEIIEFNATIEVRQLQSPRLLRPTRVVKRDYIDATG
jgi:hypothetical protein